MSNAPEKEDPGRLSGLSAEELAKLGVRVFKLRAEYVPDIGELLQRVGFVRVEIVRTCMTEVEATLWGPYISTLSTNKVRTL